MSPSLPRIFVCALLAAAVTATMIACGGDEPDSRNAEHARLTMPPDGPLTPEARRQVELLADTTTNREAYWALLRIGRDAVPALVEALPRPYHQDVTQNMLSILGQFGVAAEEAVPHLRQFRLESRPFMASVADRALRNIERSLECGLTGLPGDAEVHVVGRYRGEKELDVQLGESGHAVTEIEVIVDRTDHPVVLVLTAYDPVVWRVGLTDGADLAGVLVSGHHTQALLGIPATLPHRVISGEQSLGCDTFAGIGPEDTAEIEPRIMALLGRRIDRFHTVSAGDYFHIGGGSTRRPFHVVYSDDLKLEDYPVYHGDIPAGPRGLDELVNRGELRLATKEEIDAWIEGSGDERSHLHVGGVYFVDGAVTLPPGLFGAHSRSFIIARGAPRPDGPKGHCRFFYMKDFSKE